MHVAQGLIDQGGGWQRLKVMMGHARSSGQVGIETSEYNCK